MGITVNTILHHSKGLDQSFENSFLSAKCIPYQKSSSKLSIQSKFNTAHNQLLIPCISEIIDTGGGM